jgi:hypothetical protein
MMKAVLYSPLIAAVFTFWTTAVTAATGELTIELDDGGRANMVGVVRRWDADGNHRFPPDQNARIDQPRLDAKAERLAEGRWKFAALSPGKYDLVILAEGRLRVEGFDYPPLKEFDPFFPPDAKVGADARKLILDIIANSRHHENRVEPLYLGGDEKGQAIRALVMLIRDQPTSYEADSPGAATIRHEIWQFTWQYGGWQKDKRTKVLDRVLIHRDELRKWTWLWDPALGAIEMEGRPKTLRYSLPKSDGERKLKGLYPY